MVCWFCCLIVFGGFVALLICDLMVWFSGALFFDVFVFLWLSGMMFWWFCDLMVWWFGGLVF